MTAKKSLLLIGAGPTSSLIAYNISRNKSLKDAISINVYEKSRGIGGRFSTSRSPTNPDCYADLGAQYLTQSTSNQTSKPYFENLIQNNLIRPLETSTIPGFRSDSTKLSYACLQGTGSVVKHFFTQASISKNNINFNRRITRLQTTAAGKVEVTTDDQEKTVFDIVISTMPVPQILQLENSSDLIKDANVRKNLETVNYSTRFALGIFFDTNVALRSSTQPLNFVENDPVIRYWSNESLKRTGSTSGQTTIVVHTTIDFGAKNADHTKDDVKAQLVKSVTDKIPEVSGISENLIKSHKWRYSQVLEPYPGKPGCVKLNEQIYAAGDGLSGSGLEGCIDSAEQAVLALQSQIAIK